jgi:hypothetical protein
MREEEIRIMEGIVKLMRLIDKRLEELAEFEKKYGKINEN